MRLGPVHPGAADFQVPSQALIQPRAATDPVAGFQDEHGCALPGELTGSGETGKSGPDHNHVIRLYVVHSATS